MPTHPPTQRSWENTNSNVTFKCKEGPTGVHSVIDKVPSYTFDCAFAQARRPFGPDVSCGFLR